MMDFPLEIVALIESYIGPATPLNYIRYAAISPSFGCWFRSDHAWAKFNVYGVEGVAKHYMTSIPTATQFIREFHITPYREYLARPWNVVTRRDIEMTKKCLYAQLLLLVHHQYASQELCTTPELFYELLRAVQPIIWRFWSALGARQKYPYSDIKRPTGLNFGEIDKGLYLSLAKAYLVSGLGPMYLEDRQVAIALARSYAHKNQTINWQDFPEYLSDTAFLLEVLAANPGFLKHSAAPLLSDKEFALKAIKVSAACYNYFSERIKHDTEVREFTVERDDANDANISHSTGLRLCVQYNNPKHDDIDSILQALAINGEYFRYLPLSHYDLKQVWKFFWIAIKTHPACALHLPDRNCVDTANVKKSVRINPDVVMWLPHKAIGVKPDLKLAFFRIAIAQKPQLYRHAPLEIRRDRKLACIALRHGLFLRKFIPRRLFSDPACAKAAQRACGSPLPVTLTQREMFEAKFAAAPREYYIDEGCKRQGFSCHLYLDYQIEWFQRVVDHISEYLDGTYY